MLNPLIQRTNAMTDQHLREHDADDVVDDDDVTLLATDDLETDEDEMEEESDPDSVDPDSLDLESSAETIVVQ